MNREAYLTTLAEELRPRFLHLGAPLPQRVHVSVGFPSKGGLSAKRRRIGECWDAAAAPDGVHQLFISPILASPVEAGETLVHELAHAALPSGTGHTKPFAGLATKLGLEGKPTATFAGPELRADLLRLTERLGTYPHLGLTAFTLSQRKTQTTRMKKCTCPRCGYTVRTTAKWLAQGLPLCPVDHEPLLAEGGLDADPDDLTV